MPNIIDNLADYSKVSSVGFNPVVTNGLTTYALFGRTLNSSLNNLFNTALPLSVTANVAINSTSGVTVSGIKQLVTPDTPTTNSETIYLVMSVNPTNWTSFISSPFGANPVNSNTATNLNCQNGISGIQANLGLIISGSGASRVCSISAGGSALISADTATQAVIVNPQMYVYKIDMTNLLVTFQNLSQTAASWTNHITLTSGWSRPSIATPFSMGTNGVGGFSNSTNTYHAYVHYNRATIADEDILVYNQMKKIMSTRGVTI